MLCTKKIKLGLLASSTLLASLSVNLDPAQASSNLFRFRYEYNSGNVLLGTIRGELQADGDTIGNLSSLNASFSASPNVIYNNIYEQTPSPFLPPPLVSVSGNTLFITGIDFPGEEVGDSGNGFVFINIDTSPTPFTLLGNALIERILALDPNGEPILDQNGEPIELGVFSQIRSFSNNPAHDLDSPFDPIRWSLKLQPSVDFEANTTNLDFDKNVAELQGSPAVAESNTGLSINNLSYLLTAESTNPLEFSWNASRDFSLFEETDLFASIVGNTNLQLSSALPNNLEFFVRGFINDSASPFANFTENFALDSDTLSPLNWDLTKIVSGLPAGEHTLGIVSGVRWTPNEIGDTLLVSSQYGGSVTPVPTPALLPGLLGMGVAALRKRGRKGEGDRDESLI